ncbi:terminase large subunit domain-containing protein [Caballeronia sp. LZ001]|uniref:terminase large subunit domain-containing protein n=1 Tax=Caballeronia sp. LZ001 TaxID=3038553 RepID=UPI002861001E|nr:terminase family protein [Caballeronia sp. LZ001]MDR5801907.1 terminase family protein [Caballeronia sp. LZ001]
MTTANPFSAFPDRSQVVELAVRRAARDLFWSGWTITAIAEHIGHKRSTVETWKQRGKWDQATPVDKISDALDQRMRVLITKENKDPKDFKEIDLLGREIERMCKIQARSARASAQVGHEETAAPRSPTRRSKRNAMSDEQRQKLIDAVKDWLIGHQRIWYMNRAMRRRNILKSRQIGATFYFAMEALERALETGYNQIFLSASRAQAHVFKSYIQKFAWKAAEVELTGDPIILPNSAELIFLGTSSRTAQSYNGDLYFDEYFWVGNFATLNKVAQGMATHKHLRMTHFSTPSTTTHEAYSFWTGAHYNKGRAADQRVEIDVSHTSLARGLTCPDGQWRQIVTVEDAVAAGFDKIDIEEQRNSNSPADFANLYMCEFVDDTASVFPFDAMKRCMVDSWEAWTDVKPLEARPFGVRPVWIGYDPALSSEGDAAGCVVIAPPTQPGGKFRVLERHRWRGEDFETQAQYVREITRRYNVTKITVDATGVGYGLYRLVQQFFPRTYALQYSPELKTRLILKAQSVITNARLEFDASYTDLVQSFMSIRRSMTPSGSKLTYTAARSQEIGHADLAWACMHALDNEPLEGATRARSTVEFY